MPLSGGAPPFLRQVLETDQNRKIILVIVLVGIVGTATIVGLYALSIGRPGGGRTLPANCVKPSNGYLIIASDGGSYGIGFNDSKGHGAPVNAWPIITVKQGATVDITVCNVDVQAHSFNIITYLGGAANTIVPGQAKTFQFVADQVGTFIMYCNIFCPVHPYMQNGELIVTG